MSNLFVFDVESERLFGKGFAWGAVVYSRNGDLIDQAYSCVNLDNVNADDWVKENVFPNQDSKYFVDTFKEMRDNFWNFYMKHKDTCEIWSDVNFPVETNFLSDVAIDDLENRQWMMPYPLRDISNYISVHVDRDEFNDGMEIKRHDPLFDAKLSAKGLLTILNYTTND